MRHKIYDYIFDEYEMYYGSDSDEVVRWEPSGKREITVYYASGVTARYDSVSHSVYNTHPRKIGEEFISDDIYMKRFAWKLRAVVNSSNLTRDDICERCGISNATFYGYLNGRSVPSIVKLKRLAKVLRCPIEDLMNVDEWDV